MEYEIRHIDAWNDGENWAWNDSYALCNFTTKSRCPRKAFLAKLREYVSFKRGSIIVVNDGDIMEVQDRKTGEPLYAAIPIF